MGLDNGIKFRAKDTDLKAFIKSLHPKYQKSFSDINRDEEDNEMYSEICYMRKCHGIRDEIKATLQMKYDQYLAYLDSQSIGRIIEVYTQFLSKSYWNENARSIWDYDKAMVKGWISDLTILQKVLAWCEQNNVEYKCFFYDSY